MASLTAQDPTGTRGSPGGPGGSAARALYVRANDPEAALPGGRLVAELRAELRRLPAEVTEPELPAGLDALRDAAAAWAGAEADRYRQLALGAGPDTAGAVLRRRAVLGTAPLGLVAGGWLQWLSGPETFEDTLALRVLTLYAADVGVGHPRASRGAAYLDLLRHLRLAEHAAPAARLPVDKRIADAAFALPALLLTMSRRPDDFRAELLGADDCLRTVGLPPALVWIAEELPASADWAAIDLGASRAPGGPSGLELSRAAVAELLAGSGGAGSRAAGTGVAERVEVGFRWALSALRRHSDTLLAELGAARDPAYEMAELLRLRAREGAVYHQGFQLEGRSLSDWLREARDDPSGLLAALAGSRLVKPGRSGASALVNGLVGERGPMFRVFGDHDLTVVRRWIDALPAAPSTGVPPVEGPAVTPRAALVAALDDRAGERDRAPGDLREAYHLLQRRTDTSTLRRWALAYVRQWLDRSAHGLEDSDPRLPDQWGPEGLRPWLVDMHDRHGADFEAGADSPVPSRAALVEQTVQLAPLTLIDGSWLQGFTDHEQAAGEVGHFLFETYWDELGNGQPRLNHPLIYRQVLAEMDVTPPPSGTAEFARWPGFRDASFELPVYWLCIGRFPRTFLPEVLGLNLAMELSGVGGTYRRARIALKAHGFSTRFVDVHNTIDNVATGHSAWAADAVDTYLSGTPEGPGPGGREQTWHRVRVGYRSLNPPPPERRARQTLRRVLGGSR